MKRILNQAYSLVQAEIELRRARGGEERGSSGSVLLHLRSAS